MKIEKHFLRCKFSDEEVLELGKRLAQLTQEHVDTEAAKAAAADFSAKLKRLASEVEQTGRKVRNGFEHRYVECRLLRVDRRAKRKWLIREDTGEEITETASDSDCQLDLTLGDGSSLVA